MVTWWWRRITELEHRADELGQVIPVYRAALERIAAGPPSDARKLARTALVFAGDRQPQDKPR